MVVLGVLALNVRDVGTLVRVNSCPFLSAHYIRDLYIAPALVPSPSCYQRIQQITYEMNAKGFDEILKTLARGKDDFELTNTSPFCFLSFSSK